jgi:hypothetical protein
MRPSEREKFAVGLRALGAVFRTEVTEALIEGYWLGLDDVELTPLGQAMRRAIRECKFMPSPAELREFAGMGKHRKTPEWKGIGSAERARIRESWRAAYQLEAVEGGE